MRTIILILVWLTPAIVAGVLGWKGIWGTGSAFFDYLIPIPVAGGVFHVPSFAIAAIVILTLKAWPQKLSRLVPLIALSVFLVAQTLQLDFDRLNAWFFTDYKPHNSPLKFDGNPLFLFIAMDALWVAVYAFLSGCVLRGRHWLLLPVVPMILIGAQAAMHKTSGPQFTYGFTRDGMERGTAIAMIYTPNTYDEKSFRDWWETDKIVTRPWNTPNAEHLAVLFSRSMQDIKWGKMDNKENIVATFCIYEEDQSLTSHAGYYDCFVDHLTVMDRVNKSAKENVTGLGREVDFWFAEVKLCEGVEVSEKWVSDNEFINLCRGLKQNHSRLLERLIKQYGEDSEQIAFVKANTHLIGIADTN